MKRKEKLRTMFIIITLLLFAVLHSDTIIDTVYSTPELDGSITYLYNDNSYWISTVPTTLGCGDGWGGLIESYWWERGYVSFPLPDIPEGYNIETASFHIYQLDAYGNDLGGYPIWDVNPLPDTTDCVLDHIDYGNQLNVDDWTAGNPGDTQTLHTNIGIISDNAEFEYKTMDITEYVLDDYENVRDKTQYRIRFWINTDWDEWRDGLAFRAADTPTIYKPFARLVFSNVSSNEETLYSNSNFLNTFPNPFNGKVSIEYSMSQGNNILEIYNIKGQRIYLRSNLENEGTIVWNCGAKSSGLYFVKISNKNEKIIKRTTFLK